jgi:peptidoglycan/LPS O-acetylase OafA/YrhL
MKSRTDTHDFQSEAATSLSEAYSVDAPIEATSSADAGLSRAGEIKTTTDGRFGRIAALDFTKGTLVLVMVLYHWLSYFHGPFGSMFKYLRFLPPSFIFITGFLVSNAYLRKYKVTDPRLPKRLAIRGIKILAIFIVLNVVISFLFTGFRIFSPESLWAVYVTGNVLIAGAGKAAAFYILVPISYLLLLSAILVIVCRYSRYAFWVACALCLAGVFVLDLQGLQSANLELVSIGLLGLILGYLPLEKLNNFVRYPFLIVGANLSYLAVVTLREPNYPLQIVGVCLTLMLIYLVGTTEAKPGPVRKQIIVLGKYPLFGYIFQIAILQLLRFGMSRAGLGPDWIVLPLAVALALTVLSIIVLDRVRSKSIFVDRLYNAVFA